MSDGVVHITSNDVTFEGRRRRQRCVWCGALIVDDDLTRMAWPLNPDGTDPGPPGAFPAGRLVETVGELGAFSIRSLLPLEDNDPNAMLVPDNGCCRLDPFVTGSRV